MKVEEGVDGPRGAGIGGAGEGEPVGEEGDGESDA